MKEEWAANVIGKMHRLGIKQKDLAKRCGYSAPYLCTVLCGKKKFKSEYAKKHTARHIEKTLDEMEAER